MKTSVHAPFSPSEKSWIRYDKDKILNRIRQMEIVERGTALHELAAQCIKLRVQLDASNGIISDYVRDCIF